jgi:endonuclease III
MEVEVMKRMVKRWEDNRKGAVSVTNQDSEMAKVIPESRWNVTHEYNVNHAKRRTTAIIKNFQRRSHSYCTRPGGALGTGFVPSCISPSPVTK